jgi:PAS domain S-box-containing protein
MDSFAGLLNNAALMLILCVIYDTFGIYAISNKNLRDCLTGVLVGLIGIAVMLSPWSLQPGVFFDTRWVLLSLCGLFFGLIPTAVAVIIAGAFRLYQGGLGGIVGTVVIVVTACVGLAWKYWKDKHDKPLGWKQLYAFGVLVQLAMLSCMFLMPADMRIPIIKAVAPPILIIYPILTMIIGLILKRQEDRRCADKELVESRKALIHSEKQLHTLLQNIQAGVVVHGPDTEIIACNKASQELLGLTEDQMLGKEAIDPSWRFCNEDGSTMPLEDYPITHVITKKNVLKNFVAGIYRPNESDVIWVLVNAVPEFDADGNITRVVVTFMDITDRQIAEIRLQNIFNTSIPICITNADYQIVLSNDAYKDIFEQSELSESPVKCYESRPGPACQTDACPMKRVLSGEKEVVFEPTKINADGSKQYFIVTARPFLNNKGQSDGIVECFQDITDRKKAETERDNLIEELKKALSEIKTLRGILPICSFCKNIRNDEGYYEQIEGYIHKHSGVDFSHTICPDCLKKHYPEEYDSIIKKKGE